MSPLLPHVSKADRAPAAGFWITADGRFSVHRPMLIGSPGRRQARFWNLWSRMPADRRLLAQHGLLNTRFASRREALHALATMMHAEGL